MTEAAAEAVGHLTPRLRGEFGSKSWDEFSARLSEHAPRLFGLLHRLYGWRYDFAWIYEQMIEVTAEGVVDRPKKLRRLDRRSGTSWTSEPRSLWAQLDQQTDDRGQLREHLDHLASLGVTHLNVGHAKRSLNLSKLARDLHERGMTLALEVDGSQVQSGHPWMKKAARGDDRYTGFFFMFENRESPDRYVPHLRSSAQTMNRDAFAWHPDVAGGRWVWSTLGDGKWDLDYSNPDVLAAMAAELLKMANDGAGVLTLRSLRFAWKQVGTDCENLPEAHVIAQILRTITEIAAPSVVLAAGPSLPAPGSFWSDRSFVGPNQCQVGWNSLLASSVWEAIATSDTRLLTRTIGDHFQLPPGCGWLTYLRSEEPVGWNFANDDAMSLGIDPVAHRDYLDNYYLGRWPRSTARGTSAPDQSDGAGGVIGAAVSLAGLEAAVEGFETEGSELAVRRILAAWSVILGVGGVPVMEVGDIMESQGQLGPEDLVQAGVRHLLDLRRTVAGFGPEVAPDPIDLGENALIAFRRGPVFVLVNFSSRPAIVPRDNLPGGDLIDLITDDDWNDHVLGPYEFRYLIASP